MWSYGFSSVPGSFVGSRFRRREEQKRRERDGKERKEDQKFGGASFDSNRNFASTLVWQQRGTEDVIMVFKLEGANDLFRVLDASTQTHASSRQLLVVSVDPQPSRRVNRGGKLRERNGLRRRWKLLCGGLVPGEGVEGDMSAFISERIR